MSIPLPMVLICACISAFPYTATTLKSVSSLSLSESISSLTCRASSLVGRTMRNLARWFFSKTFYLRIRSMMGSAKASVFPEPVLSRTIRSLPSNNAWKVLYCTGNRDFTPFFLRMSMVLGLVRKFSSLPGSSPS
jgi:hypothetical protein